MYQNKNSSELFLSFFKTKKSNVGIVLHKGNVQQRQNINS